MTIRLSHSTTVPDGELPVEINSVAVPPFVTIDLDDRSNTYLVVKTVEDADRLIRAAVEAKRLLSPPPETPADAECPCGHLGAQHLYGNPESCTQCDCPAFGTPVTDEDAGPFGPEAYKAHKTACICWDCEGARKDAAAITAKAAEDGDSPLSALVAAGYKLIPDEHSTDGYVLDLRRPDGTLAETGCGPTQGKALEHLCERLARSAGSPA